MTFNIIKASAEVVLDFKKGAGFETGIELFSLEGSLMITDTLGIKAEIRLGAEVAFYVGVNSTEISVIWWSVKIVY